MNSTSEIERRKEAAIDALRLKAFETNSDADRQAYFDAVSKWFQDRHIRRVNAERVPFLSVQGAVKAEQNITRPIVGIENRTAQEVFDIMRDRILSALEPSAARELAFEEILRELSGNPGELIDMMAEAIRGDTVYDDTPWATLSEDRKIGWRGDAERALAVVKEYLTARRPSEQAVTEAMELARAVLAQSITAGHNVPGPTPEDIEKAFWALDAALKSAMEAGR